MDPGRNSRGAGARVLDLPWSAREQLRAPAKPGSGDEKCLMWESTSAVESLTAVRFFVSHCVLSLSEG